MNPLNVKYVKIGKRIRSSRAKLYSDLAPVKFPVIKFKGEIPPPLQP